ncbi:MAG TPA: hypothetical protein VE860_22855, partial [Chthoniobacterales bacterium]|nr:hypothetical protein [Chthoniobacterales bacterium]
MAVKPFAAEAFMMYEAGYGISSTWTFRPDGFCAGGLLSGKYRRGQQPPDGSRHLNNWGEPPIHDEEQLYTVIDVLVEIA